MNPTMKTFYKLIPSPVGELKIVANDSGLLAILWENDPPARVPLNETEKADEHPLLTEAAQQLAEYFAGKRETFDLKLAAEGTPFQKRVWAALRQIPYGETRTYAQIAEEVGQPKAVRAVGAANGRNPISIVVPCHRVIGSNGTLTGFAGGLKTKSFLLQLESKWDLALV